LPDLAPLALGDAAHQAREALKPLAALVSRIKRPDGCLSKR
jgi:hypothetical protein